MKWMMAVRGLPSLAGALLIWGTANAADCPLDELVGATLILHKKIEAHVDNGVRSDGYEGCEWGRVLVFTDGTAVQCTGYTYHYAYFPDAYIFAQNGAFNMCVAGADQLVAVAPVR